MNNAKVNQSLLKNVNRKKILSVINDFGEISRTEVTNILKKNGKTVTNIIIGLIEDGLIVNVGYSDSTGGRKRELFTINPDYGYLIGIHLGVHSLRGIITDFKYNIIANKIIPISYEESKESLLLKIKAIIDDLVKRKRVSKKKLLGIGFVANGVYNKETGVWIDSSNNLNWKNIPIRDFLTDTFNLPVVLERNSRSMALWEMYFGIATKNNNIIYINIGAGISSVFINNRKLYKGTSNNAGEFGHIIVEPNGHKCTCGKIGCLEAVSSGWAIINQIKNKIENGAKSEITDLCNNNLNLLDIDMMLTAFNNGDKVVCEVVNKAINYMGISVANLIELDNPELIIFGGQFAKNGNLFFEKLKIVIKKHTTPLPFKEVNIVVSSSDKAAVVLGVITKIRKPYFAIEEV